MLALINFLISTVPLPSHSPQLMTLRQNSSVWVGVPYSTLTFRHVKVDPGDYDLLGLYWDGHYVDSCIQFGTRHGSQIFQRLSDAVRFMMRQKGFTMLDYIDDYVGLGILSVVRCATGFDVSLGFDR